MKVGGTSPYVQAGWQTTEEATLGEFTIRRLRLGIEDDGCLAAFELPPNVGDLLLDRFSRSP